MAVPRAQDTARPDPLAQLKSSFIRQFPKQGLFTRKSHPQRVGGTYVGGCPSLFIIPVLPKCPPSSTVSQSLLSIPTPSQIPHFSPASSSSPRVCIPLSVRVLPQCPAPSLASSSPLTILLQPKHCCPSCVVIFP